MRKKVCKLLIVAMMLPIMTLCSMTNICLAEEHVSEEDINAILNVISKSEFSDGQSIIVNDKYLVTCDMTVITVPSLEKNAYSVTRSASQTFTATHLGSKVNVFTVSQTVTAVFNTYTGKVKISSHSANFTAIDKSYRLISSNQAMSLNVWNTVLAGGRIEMIIGQGSATGLLRAYATVYSNETFNLRFEQVY